MDTKVFDDTRCTKECQECDATYQGLLYPPLPDDEVCDDCAARGDGRSVGEIIETALLPPPRRFHPRDVA